MAELARDIEQVSKKNRSRLSNNAQRFLDKADGRSKVGRRYRDAYLELIGHLGGQDNVSVTRHHLVKRTAALITWCETVEDEFIQGETMDLGIYCTGVNSLRRLLLDVGLDPRPKDITPTFDKVFRTVIDNEPHDEGLNDDDEDDDAN